MVRAKFIPLRIVSDIRAEIGGFIIKDPTMYAWYRGEAVTEVPAGASFEIHCEYTIQNTQAGFSVLWSTCMTVYDVTHSKPIGSDIFNMHSGGGVKSAHDAVNVKMPDEPTTFRVKIFGYNEQISTPPPVTEW